MMSPIKYLQTAEVKKLLTVITDPRDRALFGLIYSYGLRVAEATLVQLSERYQQVKGNGRGARCEYFSPIVEAVPQPQTAA